MMFCTEFEANFVRLSSIEQFKKFDLLLVIINYNHNEELLSISAFKRGLFNHHKNHVDYDLRARLFHNTY